VVVVRTAPWHERDTQSLVERLGVPVFVPPPDTADDLVRKYGISPEQAAGGSPDVAWLLAGDGSKAHVYAAGDRLPIRHRGLPGREHNDLVPRKRLAPQQNSVCLKSSSPCAQSASVGCGLQARLWLRGQSSDECILFGPDVRFANRFARLSY
jgi:hypothetical protein